MVKRKKILFRTTVLSWSIIALTLLSFVIFMLPLRKQSLLNEMKSKASIVATSTSQMIVMAIVAEDYSKVVDYCQGLVEERPFIKYVVVSKGEEFYLVSTSNQWSYDGWDGSWESLDKSSEGKYIVDSTLAGEKVFHYSMPFDYLGIDWGTIHVGISLDTYYHDLNLTYVNTIFIVLACLIFGLLISYFFAKKFTSPIRALSKGAYNISKGDFDTQVVLETNDEFQDLAGVFNMMTKNLKDSNESLIQAEKMAAVGTLASGVSHEFNNVLGIAIGFLELIDEEDNDLSEETRERLNFITESLERAINVTRNLLSFSRKENFKKQSVRLVDIARQTLAIISKEFQTGGIVLQEKYDESVFVSVDDKQIGQVFLNLCVNARHAMMGKKDKKLSIEIGQQKGCAYFKVSDKGCGIASENINKIFEPFYSSKGEHAKSRSAQSKVSGTGLGLSICKTIVESHDGTIEVESEEGKGTSFIVSLPIAEQEIYSEEEEKDDEIKVVPHARIAILDDEKLIRNILERTLSRVGYDVILFDDGYNLVEVMKKEKIDLVLLDMQMPKMSGEEFLQLLQKDLPKERMPEKVIISGNRQTPEDYLKYDVFGSLQKPFKLKSIYDTVYGALMNKKMRG